MYYLCVYCFNVLFDLKFCRIYGGEWNVYSVVVVWLEYGDFHVSRWCRLVYEVV